MVELIKMAANDPVLVMFDDNGNYGRGRGEQAIEYVIRHPDIEVLGAIAVASNTKWVSGIQVPVSIDNHGNIIEDAVDKDGYRDKTLESRIYGDTVDILQAANIPHVIGIGDIGKMEGRDSLRFGCPITLKAVKWILERSGWYGNRDNREAADLGTGGAEQGAIEQQAGRGSHL